MNSRLTVNQDIFSPFAIPEKVLFRAKEYSQLLANIRNSANTLIHGPVGSGKTALLRKASQELSSAKGKVMYIDCSLYQTANAVLREVLIDRPIASRNNYDLLKRLVERARNNRFAICLDHIENLKEKEIIGQLMQVGICVVITCNDTDFLSTLDLKARTGVASTIELRPYTAEQTFQILRQRSVEATPSDTYSDEDLKQIAQKTKGNITLALNILKTAAFRLEAQDAESADDIDLYDIMLEHDCPEKLNQDQKLLIRILQEWKGLPPSRLYDFYVQKSRHPKSERAFRNYMADLCARDMVKAVGDKRGRVYEVVETEKRCF